MTMRRHMAWAGLCALLAAPPPAAAATVAITKADCNRLVKHVPAPDVAYRAGVDVHGRPLVPANLGEPPVTVPGDLPILITVDAFDRFGIPANGASYDANLLIGLVVYRDGGFFFNGAPLESAEKAALAQACQRIVRAPG